MSLVRQNFEMFRGEAKLISVTVNDEIGSPLVGIDTVDFEYRLWEAPASANKQPVLELDADDMSIDEPESKVIITLEKADTVELEPGEYTHELKLIDEDGNENIIMHGTVTILYSSIEINES